jgi:hypothetical protein
VKHILYVIEIPVCGNPCKFSLLTADDESGNGRPLVWTAREDAEAYADGLSRRASREMGEPFDLDYEVVPLTGETRNEDERPLSVVRDFDANGCANC